MDFFITEILSLKYGRNSKEPICPCGCCAYPRSFVNLLGNAEVTKDGGKMAWISAVTQERMRNIS